MRRPRSDAKLLNLPDEQKARLVGWLSDGVPYLSIKQLVAKEFKVATSLGALSHFWQAYASELQQLKRHQATTMLDEFQKARKPDANAFVEATFQEIQQRAFELSQNPSVDVKSLESMLYLILKRDKQRQEAVDSSLARDKFQFDAARAAIKVLPRLKAISLDKSLDERGKIDATRIALFGEAPE